MQFLQEEVCTAKAYSALFFIFLELGDIIPLLICIQIYNFLYLMTSPH